MVCAGIALVVTACGGAAVEAKHETLAKSAPAAAPEPAAAQPAPAPQATVASDTQPAAEPSATATATTEAPPPPPSAAEPSPQGTSDVAPIAALDKLPVDSALAPEVNAGVIPRGALNVVLSRGIGRFLRYVRAEPHIVKGQFVGWRILSLFDEVPDVHVAVLRAGDTVRRANGQSIEHPEAFKSIWDSMATAKELVLDIDRAGRPSKLRYTISD
ncbi:MAG TPA: hypothetical protein VHM19_19440 [Polyangiales bacterium]|nr:hypothetical protein [Polyangiales bacterium]